MLRTKGPEVAPACLSGDPSRARNACPFVALSPWNTASMEERWPGVGRCIGPGPATG